MSTLPEPPGPGTVSPSLLLVIDVQRGFLTESSAHIVDAIEAIQTRFDAVLYARFLNPDPSPFRSILNYDKLSRGSEDAELAINKCDGSAEFEHTTYSCVNSELLYWLRDRGVSEVCVCGVATEACVLKTVVDLFENHFVPWVIKDLCASDKNTHFHDISIEVIGALIGQNHVITKETLAQ